MNLSNLWDKIIGLKEILIQQRLKQEVVTIVYSHLMSERDSNTTKIETQINFTTPYGDPSLKEILIQQRLKQRAIAESACMG